MYDMKLGTQGKFKLILSYERSEVTYFPLNFQVAFLNPDLVITSFLMRKIKSLPSFGREVKSEGTCSLIINGTLKNLRE